jgi:ubiquinone/menaquinone biosynthesis C-methylase UbiE
MSQPIYDAFARVYDLQHSTFADDLPLYVQLAKTLPEDQAILELGCGSGRVMLPLARAGRRVVGVDESPEMLAIARQHLATLGAAGASCELIEADSRTLALDERFGTVIIALNTFLHNATRADQLATLGTARRHLLPGGRLIIDLPPNDELAFQPDDGEYEVEATLIDPAAHSRITKSVASRIFWATQEQELTYHIVEEQPGGTNEQTVQFRLRHVFKHELELLLNITGFADPDWLGDYQQHPYADDSPRMIAVARSE